jgi:hypothetical protein
MQFNSQLKIQLCTILLFLALSFCQVYYSEILDHKSFITYCEPGSAAIYRRKLAAVYAP